MSIAIRPLDARTILGHADALVALLKDNVEGGASVGFMLPFDEQEARYFWGTVTESVAGGRTALFGAFEGKQLVGCVILACETMPNQRHRADIRKLLVDTMWRRRGIGRALMAAAVGEARKRGLELLTLDTATPEAERLYEATGWTRVGIIPNFARYPDGSRGDTVYYYLNLEA